MISEGVSQCKSHISTKLWLQLMRSKYIAVTDSSLTGNSNTCTACLEWMTDHWSFKGNYIYRSYDVRSLSITLQVYDSCFLITILILYRSLFERFSFLFDSEDTLTVLPPMPYPYFDCRWMFGNVYMDQMALNHVAMLTILLCFVMDDWRNMSNLACNFSKQFYAHKRFNTCVKTAPNSNVWNARKC